MYSYRFVFFFISKRDLAARNCLLSRSGSDKLEIKIGDFDLARSMNSKDYYKIKNNKPMPIR